MSGCSLSAAKGHPGARSGIFTTYAHLRSMVHLPDDVFADGIQSLTFNLNASVGFC